MTYKSYKVNTTNWTAKFNLKAPRRSKFWSQRRGMMVPTIRRSSEFDYDAVSANARNHTLSETDRALFAKAKQEIEVLSECAFACNNL